MQQTDLLKGIAVYKAFHDLKKVEMAEIFKNNLSKNTYDIYVNDFQQFIDTTGLNEKEVKPDDIIKYIETLENKGYQRTWKNKKGKIVKQSKVFHYKNASINRKIAALSTIFTYHLLRGDIVENPVKIVMKVLKNRSMKITRNIAIDNGNIPTLQQIRLVTGKVNKSTVMIDFIKATGVRKSEMINIRNEHVTDKYEDGIEYKQIYIKGKRNKEGFVYISNALYEKIKKVFNIESEYLFMTRSGRPLLRSNVYTMINKAFKRIGMNCNVHNLRHFYGTYQVRNGVDIKGLSLRMRHSSVSTTIDRYVKPSLSVKDSIIE